MRVIEETLAILGSEYVNEDNKVDYDTVLLVFAENLHHHGIDINRGEWRQYVTERASWLRGR